ncbi:MAG: hypothetical protein CSB32_01695 [Desulfobacterales bacterium]|nr:MAG: hypothetical protein CSB32_01695 [Desulfobacterales bacterium]
MVYGGFGLGRLSSGQVILVPCALPGETLIVTIQQQKKNHLFGEITEILTAHPLRISPLCPHRQCGGCNLHHTTYHNQLAIKEEMLTDLLRRQMDDKLAAEISATREAILPSPNEFGYRQRIRLRVQNGKMGFRGRSSHSLVGITVCNLAKERLNQALCQLHNEPETSQLLAAASDIELLEDPVTEKVVLLLHLLRPPRPVERKQARAIAEKIPLISRVFFTGRKFALEGPYPQQPADKRLSYQYDIAGHPLRFGFEVGCFCQVNLDQNEKLIALVCAMADVQQKEKILDLYCGVGNFALPLAACGADVFGIEGQGGSIRSARENADNAGLSSSFIKSPVESACRQLAAEKKRFDTVIIDPPRRGIPQLAEPLTKLTIKKLIYISCDPATMMRDLRALCRMGFTVTAFQPVDMFPQTHHIESVVCLTKER